jgi:hypothetical protein
MGGRVTLAREVKKEQHKKHDLCGTSNDVKDRKSICSGNIKKLKAFLCHSMLPNSK